MADNEDTLEDMMARGEILDIGEVVIENEEGEVVIEEDEIPVYVEEDVIDRSMLPTEEFVPGKVRLTPLPFAANGSEPSIDRSRLPDLVIYTGPRGNPKPIVLEQKVEPTSIHAVRVEDAQKRLRMLPSYMLEEPGVVSRVFGATTERDRLKAFGDYFSEFLGNRKGYLSPAEFVVMAELALLNLKAGEDGGRPIRKSIREALAGKDEKVYNAIREKLPEIARAVATTGFAVELNQIYNDAGRARRNVFEYAQDIKRERYVDSIAERLIREGLK